MSHPFSRSSASGSTSTSLAGRSESPQVLLDADRDDDGTTFIAPIHSKAMPLVPTTTREFDLWLEGETVEALKLQRPLPDGMLDIVARGEKEDPPVEAVAV